MELELRTVSLRAGDQLEVKGFIPLDSEGFAIDLGFDPDELALHFKPHFDDKTDGSVIVLNSMTAGSWDDKRKIHNPLHKGTDVKIILKLTGDMFEVELPDGKEVRFPNRTDMDVINYVRVKGDLKLTSFKIC